MKMQSHDFCDVIRYISDISFTLQVFLKDIFPEGCEAFFKVEHAVFVVLFYYRRSSAGGRL